MILYMPGKCHTHRLRETHSYRAKEERVSVTKQMSHTHTPRDTLIQGKRRESFCDETNVTHTHSERHTHRGQKKERVSVTKQMSQKLSLSFALYECVSRS